MKSITKDVENKVINHLENDHSYRETAKEVGISYSTVKNIANRLFPNRVVSKKGRPPKLTHRDKLYCVRQITTGRKETAVDVKKSLENEVGVSVSDDTVRRAMKLSGLGAIVKPKKPHLSSKNIKERLAWAKEHVDWTIDD